MFLQFCPGGELFDYIVAREKLKVCMSVDTSTQVYLATAWLALLVVHFV